MKGRVQYVDVARGIAMLLVILSHSVTMTLPLLNKFILSFHMPLFFFISGMFGKQISGSWGGHLIKKVRVILLPQLVLSFLRMIEDFIRVMVTTRNISDVRWIHWDWFLPVLFLCSISFSLITTIFKSDGFLIKLALLVISLGLVFPAQWFNSHEFECLFSIINSRHISVLPMAFFFYVLGSLVYGLKDTGFNILSEKIRPEQRGLIVVCLIALLGAISSINSPVSMYKNDYGHLSLFFLSSLLGILLTVYISKIIQSASFLSYVGKESIAFYVWNFIVVHIVSSFLFKVLSGHVDDEVIVLFTFLIVIVLLSIIVRLSIKYVPYIYGRS